MQPSGLIFVLVVAIWAAFLLQYWIRRRDHLATVRSVDRFSTAMRVLDDHRMRRTTAEPTPRSYAVAPTRAARPEVTVKHAEAPQRARLVDPVVGAPRRVRGLTLLTMVALLPIVLLVAAFGPLPWWISVAWLVGTVAAFGWLRQAVQAERVAKATARAEERRAAARPSAPRATAARATTRAATTPAAAMGEAEPARTRPTPAAAAPFDVADVPTTPVAEDPAPQAEPAPGTWQPTPVPRPMYTMKAKAQRPEQAPAPSSHATPATPTAAGADVPQVIDVEDEELPAIAGWG